MPFFEKGPPHSGRPAPPGRQVRDDQAPGGPQTRAAARQFHPAGRGGASAREYVSYLEELLTALINNGSPSLRVQFEMTGERLRQELLRQTANAPAPVRAHLGAAQAKAAQAGSAMRAVWPLGSPSPRWNQHVIAAIRKLLGEARQHLDEAGQFAGPDAQMR